MASDIWVLLTPVGSSELDSPGVGKHFEFQAFFPAEVVSCRFVQAVWEDSGSAQDKYRK